MTQDSNWLEPVLAKDPRYTADAYELLFESVEFSRKRLAKQRGAKVGHITISELLYGIRDLALEHYGLMAKTVLNQFGVFSTSDIGEIFFNLVESGDLERTDQDSREEFDNVFDFDDAFCKNYRISAVDE